MSYLTSFFSCAKSPNLTCKPYSPLVLAQTSLLSGAQEPQGPWLPYWAAAPRVPTGGPVAKRE